MMRNKEIKAQINRNRETEKKERAHAYQYTFSLRNFVNIRSA